MSLSSRQAEWPSPCRNEPSSLQAVPSPTPAGRGSVTPHPRTVTRSSAPRRTSGRSPRGRRGATGHSSTTPTRASRPALKRVQLVCRKLALRGGNDTFLRAHSRLPARSVWEGEPPDVWTVPAGFEAVLEALPPLVMLAGHAGLGSRRAGTERARCHRGARMRSGQRSALVGRRESPSRGGAR
jgi:hypothetical protein